MGIFAAAANEMETAQFFPLKNRTLWDIACNVLTMGG